MRTVCRSDPAAKAAQHELERRTVTLHGVQNRRKLARDRHVGTFVAAPRDPTLSKTPNHARLPLPSGASRMTRATADSVHRFSRGRFGRSLMRDRKSNGPGWPEKLSVNGQVKCSGLRAFSLFLVLLLSFAIAPRSAQAQTAIVGVNVVGVDLASRQTKDDLLAQLQRYGVNTVAPPSAEHGEGYAHPVSSSRRMSAASAQRHLHWARRGQHE